MNEHPILEVQNLKKYFNCKGNFQVKAVDDVSFIIYPNEILGLVGESGSGKTTLARSIMRLYQPTEGDILFEEKSIYSLSKKEKLELCRKMQYIFQDPYSSLDPRMTIQEIITEPLTIHNMLHQKKRSTRAEELLKLVGLQSATLSQFPHQLSGGQRQRIGIARALALNPRFIVCDEPIASLDVSIQAQIINLLRTLQEEMGLTFLFISHDLAVVRYISNRVAVMYHGHLVELAPSRELYETPLHPYTSTLLTIVPIPCPEIEKKRSTSISITRNIPISTQPSQGCVFHHQCPKAMPICQKVRPKWKEFSPGHYVACHLI